MLMVPFVSAKVAGGEYLPVAVVWRQGKEDWGSTEGRKDGLYWAPRHLGLPSVAPFHSPESGTYVGEMVPVEHLFWVIEPKRLSMPVRGKPFEPFTASQRFGSAQRSMDGDGDDHGVGGQVAV
jgi:hypothetical protein